MESETAKNYYQDVKDIAYGVTFFEWREDFLFGSKNDSDNTVESQESNFNLYFV